MPSIYKMRKRFKAHYTYYVLIFCFALVLFAAIILKPQTAHAEAIFEVLKDKDPGSPGAVIQGVWKSVMTLVNSLVIAVLIFIAFANILRININTYSVKKFLPALVMAILLANFSYLICRLLVDLANVAMSLFINGSGSASGVAGDLKKEVVTKSTDEGYMRAFVYKLEDSKMVDTSHTIQWSYIGSTFFYTIFQFFAAAIMLILALLFFIRNYVIYFLVAMAPLAFASTVLPQTKSLFNMWWSNFWKWTYMPIVSIFWIWLGAQWISLGALTGGAKILPAAFGIVCFYLALTTPFKMGGGIMAQWSNLGKKVWGATGGKVTDYYKAKSAATWGARWQNIQNTVKDKYGIGGGLDMAQQKLADAQKRKGLIQEEAKGAYIEKAGKKRALWEVENMGKEGTAAFKEKEQLKNLITETDETGLKGRKLRRARRSNALVDRVEEMRTKSQEAMLDLAVFDADWNKLNNVLKTRFLSQKDAHGNDIAKDSDEYKKREAFVQQYAHSLWQANVSERAATKAANDPIKNAAEERTAVDNIVQDKERFDALLKSVNRLVELQNKAVKNADEVLEFEQLNTDLTAAGYSVDDPNDLKDSQEYIESRQKRAGANYDAKALEYAKGAPVYVQDLMSTDAAGKVTFNAFTGGKLERSRTGQYVNEEIKAGAAVLAEQYSMREIMNTLMHGDAREGIEQIHVDNFNQGKAGANTADINRKIEEFAVAARMTGGMNSQRPGAPIYVSEQLERLKMSADKTSDVSELKRLVHEINYTHRALEKPADKEVRPASESAEHLAAAVKEYYNATNENKKAVMNALNANSGLGNEGRPSMNLR